ncbi:hypothetical protein [Scytonema sp. HK-05]
MVLISKLTVSTEGVRCQKCLQTFQC